MAKTIATILGVGFLLVGVIGFVAPGILGMHLSLIHNIIHLVSGALALYFGLKGTMTNARIFCIVFGAIYALLGIVGFIGGEPGTGLLTIIPGQLVLGTMDHIVHIILGTVFLIGGFVTKVVRPLEST